MCPSPCLQEHGLIRLLPSMLVKPRGSHNFFFHPETYGSPNPYPQTNPGSNRDHLDRISRWVWSEVPQDGEQKPYNPREEWKEWTGQDKTGLSGLDWSGGSKREEQGSGVTCSCQPSSPSSSVTLPDPPSIRCCIVGPMLLLQYQ